MRLQEAFFPSYFASSLDCIVVSDDRGVIVMWNPAAELTFGYSKDEACGRKMADLIVPPDMRSAHVAGMDRYLETREARVIGKRIEITALHARGHSFPVELTIGPFEHEGRTYFAASIRDLTERKRIETEHNADRRFFQAVLDAMPSQLAVFDPDGKYLYVTPSAIQDPEVRDWVIGKTDAEYCRLRGIPENIAKQRISTIRTVAESGEPVHFEESFIGRDSELHHFIRYVTPVRDADGRVVQILGYGLDVTDRKNVEIELHLRNQAILASNNGVIITDPRQDDNPIVFVNPAFEHITGYPREEILGRNPRFLQGDDPQQPGLTELREALRAQQPCTVVLRNYKKDGSAYYTELAISPIFNSHGALTHFVGIQTDVSERIRVQEEIEQARDSAVAADRAKSDFLAVMSHEIRTPMNGVIGATEVLQSTTLDEKQRGLIETIRSSGDLLLSIINDILDFSKIEAGKFELDRQPIRIRPLIDEAVGLCEQQARRKGLRIEQRIDPSVPERIVSDGVRLRQVLVNLISNAVKFTTTGSVHLDVMTHSGDGRRLLRFQVKDTGIGMTAESLSRIFEPFVQVDSSPTREYGGTGLGLAITQRLVSILGGRLEVDSVQGKGSVFRFSIDASAADIECGAPDSDEPVQAASHFPGIEALVVEDNPVNRHVLLAMLAELHIAGEWVPSGFEAMSLLEKRRFDIVFMDIQMVTMDGRETTSRIRSLLPAEQQPVVIAVTANVLVGERERSLDAGMNDFLGKPLRMKDLMAVLHKWIPDKRVRSPITEHPASLLDTPSLEQITALRDGATLLNKLIEEAHRQIPELLGLLRDQLSNGNPSAASKTAHKLAGTCGTLGFSRLRALAAEFQACVPTADLATLSAIIEKMACVSRDSFAALEEMLKSQ